MVTQEASSTPVVSQSLLDCNERVECLVQLKQGDHGALDAIDKLCARGAVEVEAATLAQLRRSRDIKPWTNGSHFRMVINFGADELSRHIFRTEVLPHLRSFRRP